jgi:hypothetical protein
MFVVANLIFTRVLWLRGCSGKSRCARQNVKHRDTLPLVMGMDVKAELVNECSDDSARISREGVPRAEGLEIRGTNVGL